MLGSDVIEVGIGMALLFLSMSLIATVIRESIEHLFKSRARDLERGIVELLRDETTRSNVANIYKHPLIASLYKGDYKAGARRLPSYIPRRNFATALLDIVAGTDKTHDALSVDKLRKSLQGASGSPNPMQRVILTAIDSAGTDLGKVRTAVEDWYDATMDRASGWYKRRTGRLLIAIGLLSAAILNVDAVTVAERLVRDKALRNAAVAQAEAMVGTGTATPPAERGPDKERLTALRTQLAEIGFPIGWTWAENGWPYPTPQFCTPEADAAGKNIRQTCAWNVQGAASVALGWLMTALAISLGAPFWFDVMNKFMIVRSTVKPKEKSPDEASVDRQSSRPAGTS